MLDTILSKNIRKESTANSNSHFLSLVKSVSWRIVGTIDTMLIAYFVTGKIQMAVSIGSVEVFTKIVLYYLHDRAWELARAKKTTTNDN